MHWTTTNNAPAPQRCLHATISYVRESHKIQLHRALLHTSVHSTRAAMPTGTVANERGRQQSARVVCALSGRVSALLVHCCGPCLLTNQCGARVALLLC